MKKLILSLLFVFTLCPAWVSAQSYSSAIGLRFGYWGGEISYLRQLYENKRIEADIRISTRELTLIGIHQWVWDLSKLADGFNWYAGVGPLGGLGGSSFFKVGIVGQVGIEYNLSNIPLQFSFDYRPAFYVNALFEQQYIDHQFNDICLSARYKF